MLALLAAAAIAPLFGPTLNPGVSTEFQREVLTVTDALQKGDFEGARKALAFTPTGELTIEWDDHNVPAADRPQFLAARDRALQMWANFNALIHPKIVAKGGVLKFSFEKELALNPETGIRAGYAALFGDNPAKPRLEVVIGLTRGEPAVRSRPTEVYNEIAHGVGVYYGLAESPYIGTFMGRSDLPTERENMMGYEGNAAKANLKAIDELRGRIDKRQRVTSARPHAVMDPLSFDGGDITQGDQYAFNFQLTNTGNAPLTYRIVPDCTCYTVLPGEVIQPGTSFVIHARMDSTNYSGELHHRIAVFTNDIDVPVRVMPFTIRVQPRYRLIFDAPEVKMVANGPTTLTAYLFSAADRPIKATAARVMGIPGTVTIAPWKGELADPAMKEGAKLRQGTKLTLTINPSGIVGRSALSLEVDTDDKAFGRVRTSQTVQRGIAALPGQVFFGEVSSPYTTSFLLSQPGRAFQILSMTSDSPYVKAIGSTPHGVGEYKVEVKYLGGAPVGFFNAILTVKTDDPNQPVVKVPIQAVIR